MSDIKLYSNNEIKPASFVNGILRHKQTGLIVDLLVDCIKNEKRITMDEILTCWFKADQRQFFRVWYKDKEGETRYNSFMPNDKKNILRYCRNQAEARARQWFMNNLGAAIIKGKILAIPVIELDKPLPGTHQNEIL